MTPHIQAKVGDYSEIILMPGDPLRAKHIAEYFLEDVVLVNEVRNCLGYTGKFRGKKISVQASGMGQPSLGIYATELYKFYGAKQIIRVGTCGAFGGDVSLGDQIVANFACSDSTIGGYPAGSFINGDLNLIRDFIDISSDKSLHVGKIFSSDLFYCDEEYWWRKYARDGVLGVDMETYYLYCLAKKFNASAMTVNLVVDNLETNEGMSSAERVTGIGGIVKNVLNAVLLRGD